MAIETLDDYNTQACCCALPACPVPTIECESANGSAVLFWTLAVLDGGIWKYYETRRRDYVDGGFSQYQVTGNFEVSFNAGVMVVDETENYTEGDPRTGGSTQTLSGLIDISAARTAAIAAMAAADVWAEGGLVTGTDCTTSLVHQTPVDNVTPLATLRKVRFRFKIPPTWTNEFGNVSQDFPGTYFLITYDVLQTPTTGSPSLIEEDLTISWNGPGDDTDPDDATWFTAWTDLAIPTEPGTTEIVNIRFVCRENWGVGELPQTTGTAFP